MSEPSPADVLRPGATKARAEDLAILGGEPAFAQQLFVGRPNIPDHDRVLARYREILERGWLSNAGPCVVELEDRLRERLGVRHCISMCNGTIALEIAIRAAGLSGEVIVPSFTFIATAHALQWQQITPVFCDVDPHTHNIDPRQVERLITPRTTGIIGVHLWGRPCDVDGLEKIARDRGLRLLFDAAHAFGASYRGRPVGGFGDAEIFSFHATKFFNTIEGGAVATDDDRLANEIRLMKNFGFIDYDRVDYIGTNGKMNEMCAAMGLEGLDGLDAVVERNRRNHRAYRAGLADVPGVSLAAYDDTERCNYQYVVLEVDAARSGIARDAVAAVLHAENVLARRYFHPGCHRMEPYRSYFPNAGLVLENTERLSERVLCLPTGTAVGEAEIATICDILRISVEGAEALRAALPDHRAFRHPRYGLTRAKAPESRPEPDRR